MSRRRLVVPRLGAPGDSLVLQGKDHHYLVHVLRLTVGEVVQLADGQGTLSTARIRHITPQHLELRIEDRQPTPPQAGPRLALLFAHSRRAKTEWVLQKATELGVDWLVPALCERSVSRGGGDEERKLQRWREIVAQAARQSGRARLPTLDPPRQLAEAVRRLGDAADLALVATAAGAPMEHFASPLAAPERQLVGIAVGPEGGFSPDELQHAADAGLLPVHLGPLTLRTETAAVAAATLLAYLSGRLGASGGGGRQR